MTDVRLLLVPYGPTNPGAFKFMDEKTAACPEPKSDDIKERWAQWIAT